LNLASKRIMVTGEVVFFNIGTGSAITICDLALMIAEEVGFDGRISWDTSRPNGQLRRQLDVIKAQKELGFTTPTDFREGLRQTIAWYRQRLLPIT